MPPGIVPALLRTRPVASGEHFSVHASLRNEHASMREPREAGDPVRGMLIIAAPKRVLRRAVERNAMRRVAREAWRAAALDRVPVVALLRIRGALPAEGLRARKRLARGELDRLFVSLRKRSDAWQKAS